MSTVIHFECRNATHLAARSRGGLGGIVMHHGTFGYCDGFASDGEHRWTPTGGVFLDELVRLSDDPYWPDRPRPAADPLLFAD